MPDPTPSLAKFKVDGTQLAGFEAQDTRHARQPRPLTAARVERFPGYATGYAVKGRATKPLIIVTGILRAATHAALYTLIDTHNAWVETTGIVTLTVHTATFSNCTPMAFQVTGPVKTYKADDMETPGAQAPARFVFEQLQ